MGRLHLFEFEDQAWFPNVIRDGITGFLSVIDEKWQLYKPIVPRLGLVLWELSCDKVVDFCSGSGGPWKYLTCRLLNSERRPHKVVLTDKFPSADILELNRSQTAYLEFVPYPVDATKVPKELTGFRTFFSSFHHFRWKDAIGILQDAVNHGEGIALFEMTRSHWLAIMYVVILDPVFVLLYIPFMKPFRWLRLVLTYLVPLIPLMLIFDGIVSCLRTYSPEELQVMVKNIRGSSDYNWEIGIEKPKYFPAGITYLIGYPRKDASAT